MEFGVIVFQLLVELVLLVVRVDLASIGNATFPGPPTGTPMYPWRFCYWQYCPAPLKSSSFAE